MVGLTGDESMTHTEDTKKVGSEGNGGGERSPIAHKDTTCDKLINNLQRGK